MQSIKAVVWDYDGTLVDTLQKNWRVTQMIVPAVSGRALETFPGLATPEAYAAADRRAANWRELYAAEFGLAPEQVKQAGRLWARYQLADRTPAAYFSGVKAAIASLKGRPQAIFSQNSRQTIIQALDAAGLRKHFSLVLGYEEVGFERQKPAPDGLLSCIDHMGLEEGTVYYVGDHDTDIKCARRAGSMLARKGSQVSVVAIGAAFGAPFGRQWQEAPDHVAHHPNEVAALILAAE